MLTPNWLWGRKSLGARLTRLSLLPLSLLYRMTMAARNVTFRIGVRARTSLPVPVVSIGNLTVGGTGKTPIAAWVARYYGDRNLTPAIVLRGYGGGMGGGGGGDEGRVHRRLVENAIVVENPDRPAGARQAMDNGADVIVLDDGFQRLDIARDLDIVLVSVESTRASPWTLPAGPWREGLAALRRADLVVVTRKRGDIDSAVRLGERLERISHKPVALARLGISGFNGLLSGEEVPTSSLEGAEVLAVAGIAEPSSFAGQCREFGAAVRMVAFPDHHPFSERDIPRLVHAGRGLDYVVVTEKDAVKLRGLWPETQPEPLVASLDVSWEVGKEHVLAALDAVVVGADKFAT